MSKIATVIAVLTLWWVLFPLRLPGVGSSASTERCLRMADGPTDPNLPVAQLEQCVTVVPDDVELKADLGAAYELAGRAADAEEVYLKIIGIDPDYADVRLRLAKLLLARGAIAEARLQAQETLRVQPNRQSVRELLEATARQ